jgi:hypothetical protein
MVVTISAGYHGGVVPHPPRTAGANFALLLAASPRLASAFGAGFSALVHALRQQSATTRCRHGDTGPAAHDSLQHVVAMTLQIDGVGIDVP